MTVNSVPPHREACAAAEAACEVIELLELLWERGRDAVSSAPVSASQLRVLYILEREEGINLRTLASQLGSAPSSVSRLCDRLEAVGFVERAPSPVSRRELELRLTPPARDYLHDLRAQREEVLVQVISAMKPSARKALAAGLTGFRTAAGYGSAAQGGPRSDGTAVRSA
ncbi:MULTISPECIES: MarR family winged helix-turn-helix transcriptional regulator [Streptomyces]|uniref:MarR family winged helix-turn-helix transcriptional regulator n=1 Tax=Streptomyces TaxID=1883 RepID=UPI0022499999|nr:MarR family transcriptional regulator [Streptomyces sp. JHD 1]MCX2968833.1 MarR family transcriptional regulator [Streptomyces sp. JHD 1]